MSVDTFLYSDDFLAELGLVRCAFCHGIGDERHYQLKAVDEAQALAWVCVECLEREALKET